MPDEVARDLRGWARTINRWSAGEGDPCYLITHDYLRPATPQDVADAIDRLRLEHPPSDE